MTAHSSMLCSISKPILQSLYTNWASETALGLTDNRVGLVGRNAGCTGTARWRWRDAHAHADAHAAGWVFFAIHAIQPAAFWFSRVFAF